MKNTFLANVPMHLSEQFAGVILLSGVAVPQQALTELTAMPQVYWLDPIADTNNVLVQLRQQLSQWLLLALAVTLLILLWRRGVAAACGITLMLVLAVGGALLRGLAGRVARHELKK